MEWISVKERLPKIDEWVLVFDGYQNIPSLDVQYLEFDEKKNRHYWQAQHGFTYKLEQNSHWMPLPEKPKE